MKYLLIENKGEIDVNALILMGGSTKRDDNRSIGFFGSGNKYAIALLLKNKIAFRIFSGTEELHITTKVVRFRDKEFEQILINGQETSLTTDMGPQWEPWMAIREFVSNSIDEGGNNVVNEAVDIVGCSNKTRIYIEHCELINEVLKNWDSYFTFDRTDVLVDTPEGKVFPHYGDAQGIIYYRRGIRCYYNKDKKSLYQYDLQDLQINESRVMSYVSEGERSAYKLLANNVTPQIAENFLTCAHKPEYYEHEWSWYSAYVSKMSPIWRQAIGNKILIVAELGGWFMEEAKANPHYYVTLEFAQCLKRCFPDLHIYGLVSEGEGSPFKMCETTPKIEFLLKKGIEFLKEASYAVDYPIEIGTFNNSQQLGGIKNNTILLSTKVFDLGLKELVMTIVEENEHLNTGYKDKTREFQNHFIRLFVTEMENKIGNFL